MYGQGSVTPVVPVVATAAALPVTGANNIVGIALAVAAGLAVWALIYAGVAKFGKR